MKTQSNRVAVREFFAKTMILENLKNSLKNACAGV